MKKWYVLFFIVLFSSGILFAQDLDVGKRKVYITDVSGSLVDIINNEDNIGQLAVSQPGHVCVQNSTDTPLGIDELFTGEWQDTLNYGTVTVGVKADQASATNGLVVQWSADGTTVHDIDVFTISASAGKVFTFGPARRYVRIVYTNGSVAQTSFSLETTLRSSYIKPSSHRIADSIVADDDAELVKSVQTGLDEDGVFRNAKVTRDGYQTVSDASSGLSIAKGDVTGISYVHKFGQAPDFDTTDGEVTIWDGANDASINRMVYTYSTTAAIDSISSSNAGDTQEVKVQGLDTNLALVEQTVTLNGQTRVALTTPLIRIFRGKNNGATAFAGNVVVYENTALTGGIPTDTSKIRLLINDGNNQTLMAIFTVPIDKTGYVRDWYASTAGASKDSQYVIRLWAREYNSVAGAWKTWQLKHISSISDVGTSYIQHKYEEPEKFAGGADIMMTAQATEVGASACSISAGFDIVLVDN